MACRKILIIDDELKIRAELTHRLTEKNYAVTWAHNGKVAFELMESAELPDVILLDLDLPVLNGWQFLAIQKSNPRLRDIPTLVYSSETEARTQLGGRFVAKSSAFEELLRSLDRVCEQREATAKRRSNRRVIRPRPSAVIGHSPDLRPPGSEKPVGEQGEFKLTG